MEEKSRTYEEHVEVLEKQRTIGTVKLIEDSGHGGIVLIPTPTNDPNDPLNLPTWQKYVILVVVGLFAATGNLMTSGIGALLPLVSASYHGDPRTNDLATWPAFFMGVGNLLAIPVANAVGRRPVYLLATILLAFTCMWGAYSKSLSSHIAARDIMAIAAGNAEALCPIIVQELFFLHQRGKVISYFCAIQTLGTASLIVASSYLANDLGWRWWYGIFGIINGAIAVLSILFVKETKYNRTLDAINGAGIASTDGGELVPVTTMTKRSQDTQNFAPRSLIRDMRPWSGPSEWHKAVLCWKQMFQVIWMPNVLWLILINSAALGIYVLMSTLFAGILVQPPFLWGYDMLGYVFAGQVATAVAVPFICGTLSDMVVKYMSRRNNGNAEPEYRLIALIIPFISILVSTIMYGKTAQTPTDYSWAGIAVTLNFEYFGFVGIVVSSFVYCFDCYPQRVEACLVLICSLRGFIGFGISFGVISFVKKTGYEGSFNICAGIVGALAGLGILVYIFGRQIRALTTKYARDA